MRNSVDPDQLASSEANWSWSAPFSKAGHMAGNDFNSLHWAEKHQIKKKRKRKKKKKKKKKEKKKHKSSRLTSNDIVKKTSSKCYQTEYKAF